jgi:hypothetical protein
VLGSRPRSIFSRTRIFDIAHYATRGGNQSPPHRGLDASCVTCRIRRTGGACRCRRSTSRERRAVAAELQAGSCRESRSPHQRASFPLALDGRLELV